MRIDSHQHFWIYNPERDRWITDEMSILRRDFLPGDLIPHLQANRIDRSVAVQADQSEQETRFLLALADRHPQIAGVVGWVDLCSSNVNQRLEYFSQFHKLRGVRHIVQSEPDDRYVLRDDFCAGIAALRSFNFTYDILIYPKQLPAAIELVERFPEQPFVVDHIAKPPIRTGAISTWAQHMRRIAQNRQVYCKVSGLITEADWQNWHEENFKAYLDLVFEAFGTERLMFGSDWPVCLLAGPYDRVKALIDHYVEQLSAAQQRRIFGENAIRFYGLKTSHREPATAR